MPKITETPAVTSLSANDIFLVVKNPAGIAQTAHVSVQNVFGNVSASIVISGNNYLTTPTLNANSVVISYRTTPGTSSTAAASGQIWFDSNYAYFAVANNLIKRVALQSF